MIRVFRDLYSKEKIYIEYNLSIDIVSERLQSLINNNNLFKVKSHEPFIKVNSPTMFDYNRAVLEVKVTVGKNQTRLNGFARMTRFTQIFYTYGFGFLLLFFLFSMLDWLFFEGEIIFPLLSIVLFAFSYVLFKVCRRAYLKDVQYLKNTLNNTIKDA